MPDSVIPPDPAALARRIEKLERINRALVKRIDQLDAARSSSYSLARTAEHLEREVLARNQDLERALADLSLTNRELGQAREAAEEASRAKSRFLRAASHDLLQPLSAAKLLLSHLDELSRDPLLSDLVTRIGENFDSAEELIRMLLEIARLDSQRLEIHPAPVALGRLFQRLAGDMGPQAQHIDLRFVPSSETVISDPVLLRRIAQNLVSNALKYTRSGKVLVGARRAGDNIWLEVHDTGSGIAPEDQAKIFNEFERLSRADVPGTGLGLSIVQRACLQLGHSVEVISTPGRGSCFRVLLPRMGGLCLISPKAAETRDVRAVPDCFAGRTALVVENDRSMRHAFVLLLRSWGMTVLDAESVETAEAELIRTGLTPDLILTDYRLNDGETGIDVIAAVRASLGDIPALIVSGECAEAIIEASGHLGAAVMEKPVVELDLRDMLQSLLEAQ
ncbi:hybrid sensor histidine kinase/response regulator [Frigidibacter sp. MR17.14]|uniref:ATP-binding response regulator n=1 Tax=Frigidibacter sp. MR17.14 TaxID=3126509 RepID=UPI003012C349